MYIYESGYKEAPQPLEKGEEPKTRQYDKHWYLVNDTERFHFNQKIRWSNLGKQYNWDERGYLPKESTMPVELKELACEITELLKRGDYRPEALIINYYASKNVMGGHLDDGEPDQEHPIVSFSFGLSCVFLIGGRTKETNPIAI